MSTDTLFTIANLTAVCGWLALALKPLWRRADKFVVGIVVTLLSALYVWLLASSLRLSDFAAFGSLEGISGLFQNRTALLAGWVHYLAFDLMTGLFIVHNAQKHRIPHWLAMICAVGAFMAGPAGLLLYLLIRAVRSKRYYADNW